MYDAPREQTNLLATNMFLHPVLLAHLQDSSLSIPIYLFVLCMHGSL